MAKYQKYISKLTEHQLQTLCANLGYDNKPEDLYYDKSYGVRLNLAAKCTGVNDYEFTKHIFLHDFDFYIQYNLCIERLVPEMEDANAFEHLVEGIEEEHTRDGQKFFTDFMVENFGYDYIDDCKNFLCEKYDNLADSLASLKSRDNQLYALFIAAAIEKNKKDLLAITERRIILKCEIDDIVDEQKFIYSKLAYLDELENQGHGKE